MKTDTTDNPAVGDPAATVAPQIVSQIGDAPARGILPNISLHLAGESQLFLEAQPMERINDPLFRRDVRGTNLPFVKGTAKKGAVVPLTHHVNEQARWITEGLAEVYSQRRNYLMKSGDIKILPPNGPPEFIFLRVHPGRYDRHRYLLRLGARLARRNGDLIYVRNNFIAHPIRRYSLSWQKLIPCTRQLHPKPEVRSQD